MAQEDVVVVRFSEPSKAYEALSALKEADAASRIGLESAAVVQRTSEGQLHIPETDEELGPIGMGTGSMLGMLIGVLGGPVGVLLGWGAGAAAGSLFDVDRAVTSDEALTVLGKSIPVGSTALMAIVEEPAVEVIDGEMKKLDGEVTRLSVSEVQAEVDAAEEAAAAAAREARRTIREQRKAELQERVGKAKEKLHVG
jgi:uncharacterized membrane protein